jgi:cytoskeletal protein CcmA (bactofilin family)
VFLEQGVFVVMADPNTNTQMTVIGPDTQIKGEMTFNSTAKLMGMFEGKITAKGELQVAEGATCKASVDAGKVMVDGVVEGNVTATERVQLNAKSRMKGDLVALRLIVAEGAAFTGHVSVGPDARKPGPTGAPGTPGVTEAKPGEPARR